MFTLIKPPMHWKQVQDSRNIVGRWMLRTTAI